MMSDFYVKNKQGKYLPVDVSKILGNELNGHLVVVRVGSDDKPATSADIDATIDSFNQADFLKTLDNVSIIITPYQIDINLFPKEELEEKCIYLQITSGHDILMLEDNIRKIYNKIKKNYETIVVPTPLTVGEYRQVQEILKRCQIRKERRGNKTK